MSFGAGPLPVEFVLLRGSLLGDLPLKPGTMVSGRVLELLGAGRGSLNLGGVRLEAQLPANVQPGDILRMRVTESVDERLTLKVVEQLQPGVAADVSAAAPAPLAAFALGGATARIYADEDGAGAAHTGSGGGVRTLVLRYDSELLGRMDVVVRLDDAQVLATVLAAPGEPVQAARGGADELRGALRQAAQRPAQVIVSGRAEAVDVSA